MIDIVLVESENPGNVGAIARVMKNFGFFNLILVNPKIDHLSQDARNRAKWAQDVLENAKIINWKDLREYDVKIGTTAKLGRDYNLPRVSISPKQLVEKLQRVDTKKSNIAIIFGRDGSGLTNNEIRDCDFCVSIPSFKNYPVLNISQAVGIICYELFQKMGKKKTGQYTIAGLNEKKIIKKYLTELLQKLDFRTPQKRDTQNILWQRLIGKSFLTKREAMAFIGFLKKVLEKIKEK